MKTYGKSGDKLKEITDKLEQGIEELFNSEQYKKYLKTMSKFTDYSFNNTMLIFMQRPDASHIAGYKSWQTNFNRHVKRGEKGITIIAPCPYKEKTERERTDPVTNQPVLGEDGRPATETIETTRISFRAVTVFDISQTEGEPLPSLGVDELTGSVENYAAFFETLKRTAPFPIEFKAMEGKKGYCNYQERRIAIKESMSEAQNIKTAIHEITHAQLHDYYNTAGQDAAPENKKSRNMREVEAESVAYVVCQHYGVDTAEYSFPYVAGWESHDKEILKNSLSVIRETADNLITNIDVTFQKIIQEQKQHEVMQLSEKSDSAEPIQENTDIPINEENEIKLSLLDDGNPKITYYFIDEAAAQRAKEANSFSDYIPGHATAEYKQEVDNAFKVAEQQKSRTDPMYHEKIDSLFNTYCRKLAANMNARFSIDARVPSFLITGGGNFPVRRKEKQNAARDKNWKEWEEIQGLLEKIRSTGMGGISSNDPDAIQKLERKLEKLEQSQEIMKGVNAYYRQHETLDGCTLLTAKQIEELKADMSQSWRSNPKPFESYALSNNNAEIHRVQKRIEELKLHETKNYKEWKFENGYVKANRQDNRLQIFFYDKPDETVRADLKSNGFRWAPSAGAWQRQLNDNAYLAASYISSIKPIQKEKERSEKSNFSEPEKALQTHTVCIYQLKPECSEVLFIGWDNLQNHGGFQPENYNKIWEGELKQEEQGSFLEEIYIRFNINLPTDFTGHSLSPSDVVSVDGNAYFVDKIGFKPVQMEAPVMEFEAAPVMGFSM